MENGIQGGQLQAILVIQDALTERIKVVYQGDPHLQAQIQACISNPSATTKYTWTGNCY